MIFSFVCEIIHRYHSIMAPEVVRGHNFQMSLNMIVSSFFTSGLRFQCVDISGASNPR